MSSGWTLTNIILKVRNITGTPSQDQLTDLQITDYINNYYKYIMPFELKEQIQLKFYDFYTIPFQDVYKFQGRFLTNQPCAWADGFPVTYEQDPDIFWKHWPQQYNQDPVASGDGTTVGFSGVTQAQPIAQETVYITDGDTQTFVDDGQGGFGDQDPNTNNFVSVIGAINYGTGIYNISFPNPPALNAAIVIKYCSMLANIPRGILFYTDPYRDEFNFTLRPIPDAVYKIRLQGFINPSELTGTEETPSLQEWGQLIAYGAALQIFADRGDSNSRAENYDLYQEFERVALGRYVQQLDSSRAIPRF
jgi:hypothetical protein